MYFVILFKKLIIKQLYNKMSFKFFNQFKEQNGANPKPIDILKLNIQFEKPRFKIHFAIFGFEFEVQIPRDKTK